MFWRHDGRTSVKYLLTGVIAAGVIALLGWLLLLFSPSPRRLTGDASSVPPEEATESASSTVSDRYRQALSTLRANIEQSASVAAALEKAEETFFSVRVPQALLDAHLSAVLKMRQLKALPQTEARQGLRNIIDQLLKKNDRQS